MRHVLPLFVLCACSWSPASFAQEGDEADHQALRELRAVFEKAASENQLDLLKPHLHEPFSVVTFTDREFSDFEKFKERWQKTRDEIVGSGSYKVTLKPDWSELYGDMAVAHGDSDNVLVNGAGTGTAASRFTTTTGANITLAANQGAGLVYDGTTQRWRVYPLQ